MNTLLKKIQKNSERGQAIILIAFSIVGLVAIVGLMIDGGILLIEYARLKRAIDSASIAAASQFRKGYVVADLESAGKEFLKFNQTDADVDVFTCESDTSLCAEATGGVARKLVRVYASRRVNFGFIRVIGIDSTTISATSIGEAASIDMVLVIDTSSSMAYDTNDYTPGDGKDNDPAISASQPGDDPAICNSHLPLDSGRCEPLGTIMDVAVEFVETQLLFYPYDRVAIVASTEQSAGGNRNPVLVLPFSDNQDDDGTENTEIQEAIRGLRVFQPVVCSDDPSSPSHTTSLGGCVRRAENLPNGAYETIGCDRNDATLGPSTCGSSNIGGSLYMAGRQFDFARQESFWAVVTLIGGPATATNPIEGKPEGFCPPDTWPPPNGPGNGRGCRDFDTPSVSNGFSPLTFDWADDVTRHPDGGILDPDYGFDPEHPVYPAAYDPDDYARDAADFVTSRSIGQGATLYSICLGNLCQVSNSTTADPNSGDHLGRYMAEYSGGTNANHGVYYLAPDADQLADIFLQIGNNIFTRISQ